MKLHQADQVDKWVLQICQRTYHRNGKGYEVWRTISCPLTKSTAMNRLRARHRHSKPHRILIGVAEAVAMNSIFREMSA